MMAKRSANLGGEVETLVDQHDRHVVALGEALGGEIEEFTLAAFYVCRLRSQPKGPAGPRRAFPKLQHGSAAADFFVRIAIITLTARGRGA
jgi:hypothetical protein